MGKPPIEFELGDLIDALLDKGLSVPDIIDVLEGLNLIDEKCIIRRLTNITPPSSSVGTLSLEDVSQFIIKW